MLPDNLKSPRERDRLDGLMEQFSETNATFHADYTNARKLTDEHGGSKKAPAAKPTP